MGLFDIDEVVGDYTPDPELNFETESENYTFEPEQISYDSNWNDILHQDFQESQGFGQMGDVMNAESNDSEAWWHFDQSKISSPIQDVLAGVGAGLRTGIQAAVTNPQATKSWWDTLTQTATQKATQAFQNTATGRQIEAAAIQEKVRQVATNPMTLFIGGTFFLFFMIFYFSKK